MTDVSVLCLIPDVFTELADPTDDLVVLFLSSFCWKSFCMCVTFLLGAVCVMWLFLAVGTSVEFPQRRFAAWEIFEAIEINVDTSSFYSARIML